MKSASADLESKKFINDGHVGLLQAMLAVVGILAVELLGKGPWWEAPFTARAPLGSLLDLRMHRTCLVTSVEGRC